MTDFTYVFIQHYMKRYAMFSLFQIVNESNVLVDGTLIDLCGAILLWRSREGIARMPVRMLCHSL